ncbi:MAG: hypothetical protein IEMM0001_0838 [bacterium]|nr:MAG: hypothetical protein IEMM0001_0838 [bacterium]
MRAGLNIQHNNLLSHFLTSYQRRKLHYITHLVLFLNRKSPTNSSDETNFLRFFSYYDQAEDGYRAGKGIYVWSLDLPYHCV